MEETVCRSSVCEGTFRLISEGDEPGSRAGPPAEQIEQGSNVSRHLFPNIN